MKKGLFVVSAMVLIIALLGQTPQGISTTSQAAGTVNRTVTPAVNLRSSSYYNQWPSSTRLKSVSVPYALPLTRIEQAGTNGNTYGTGPVAHDVNADGLTDYVYSDDQVFNTLQYVLLGNGSGYTVGYYCYLVGSAGSFTTYYGDCADTN